ncbi:MAG: site-specific integrase [Pseudomonadota bacterium]
MAHIEKRGSRWRVRVRLPDGSRPSQTFRTKAEAAAWAHAAEAGAIDTPLGEHTLRDALRRFASEVAPTHRGERWEILRCRLLEKAPMTEKRLQALTAADLAAWRDARLREVSAGSVRREMSLLGSVLEVARKEWGWLRASPLSDVKKPPAPASRKRRVSDDEVQRVQMALGYDGGPPTTASHRVALAFEFAVETAMRAGEILGLTWANIRPKAATLPATKNGDVRDVPLSPRAREIIALLPRDAPTVFNLAPGIRDALFRKARDRAQIENLTFHDSRAEAIWRLSKRLGVLDLARVIGHRDPRSLMLYYNISADDLADRLG